VVGELAEVAAGSGGLGCRDGAGEGMCQRHGWEVNHRRRPLIVEAKIAGAAAEFVSRKGWTTEPERGGSRGSIVVSLAGAESELIAGVRRHCRRHAAELVADGRG